MTDQHASGGSEYLLGPSGPFRRTLREGAFGVFTAGAVIFPVSYSLTPMGDSYGGYSEANRETPGAL